MVKVNIIGWLDEDEGSPVLMVGRVLPLYSLPLLYHGTRPSRAARMKARCTLGSDTIRCRTSRPQHRCNHTPWIFRRFFPPWYF